MLRRDAAILLPLFFYTLHFFSCKENSQDKYQPPESPLFVQLDSLYTGISFSNNVEDGLDYNILTYRNFYNGGGVAIGDINNDGLPDIFMTANLGESKLYLNKGNFKFEDITSISGIRGSKGWRTGVTMADVNADGWLDIYLCNSGDIKGDDKENELYINQHNKTFREQAKEFGLNDPGFTTHASFFDYDLDGDLDCYILNNSFLDVRKFDIEAIRKVRDSLGGHKLMKNENGFFKDVSEYAGISGSKIAYGLGVSVADINGDMYPDIYISNDFYEKDYLYINQQNGKYSDELPARMGHISSSSMGADIADLNNDGYMDIVTTDMLPEDESRVKTLTRFEQYHIEDMKFRYSFHYQYPQNALQLNNGKGTFSEIAFAAGIAATDWSWGALIFDFDNDGFRDIYISNGVYRDISSMDFSDFLADKSTVEKIVKEKKRFDFRDFLPFIPSTKLSNYAYVNQHDLTFQNKSIELGLGEPSFSNGVAYGDLDNDGDMDMVVNNLNAPCFVYRNDAEKKVKNHFLKLQLVGDDKNRFAVGAWVNLYTKNGKQVIQNTPVRSFQSTVDSKLIFGMGTSSMADSVEVIWPDLTKQVLFNVAGDQELTVYKKDVTGKYSSKAMSSKTLFADISSSVSIEVDSHQENKYNDFDVELLLPHMLSAEGPKISGADVNNDGMTDFYIGGSLGKPGQLVMQNSKGFKSSKQLFLENDKGFEDAGMTFFDVEKDGDLDLLVASGGYQFDQGSSLLTSRLYVNDGKGNFTKNSLLNISTNASCVVSGDIDKDGYDDIFIGGRAISGKYGLPGRSYFLKNINGILTDQTPEGMKEMGMVTGAVWSDINNDNYPDLIVVGEWMPVTIFISQGGKLEKKIILPNSAGMWNCINAADIDNDGDVDFQLGNWGHNSKFQASVEKPMELYVNDFDRNGNPESVISYFWPDGKSHLFYSKTDITTQIPGLRKKFLKYEDYAGISIHDVFDSKMMSGAVHHSIQTLASSILLNEGQANFKLMPLPYMAQLSPVFSIATDDFDKDGFIDILMGGNFFDLKPDIGRLDAHSAFLLKGNGKGKFEYVQPGKSGLMMSGQVRDILCVRQNNSQILIFARNNDMPVFFINNKSKK